MSVKGRRMTRMVELVMRESRDEVTFALVSGSVSPESIKKNRYSMLPLVKGAVTRWVKETEIGAHKWESTNGDLNVGDLSMLLDDADLIRILAEEGIFDLRIEITHDLRPTRWGYDEVLVSD